MIVPLAADFTTANIPDVKMFQSVTASSFAGVRYVAVDKGYDSRELYQFSGYRGFELICRIKRYKHTKSDRLELHFYRSKLGQHVYGWRSRSVEPLIKHIRDVFDINPLPVRGFDKARSIVLLSVLVYQMMVYYNYLTGRPLRALKQMLRS